MRASAFLATCSSFVALGLGCSDDPAAGGSSSGSSAPTVTSASFKEDVAPILAKRCALAACHSSRESNLGIHLTYDVEQLYAELQKASPTQGYKGAKFVVAGKPEQSILMAKLEGIQDETFDCNGKCGTEMPPGTSLADEELERIRFWIENGAKND